LTAVARSKSSGSVSRNSPGSSSRPLRLDPVGGGLDLPAVGDVRRDAERATPGGLHVGDGAVEAVLAAGEDGDVPAARGEFSDGGPAESGGSSGDDGDPAGAHGSPRLILAFTGLRR
jgi:hypothetical protein